MHINTPNLLSQISYIPIWTGALPDLDLSSLSLGTISFRIDALLDWRGVCSCSRSVALGLAGVVMGATLLKRFIGDMGLLGVVCCSEVPCGLLPLKSASLRRSAEVSVRHTIF